MKAGLPGRVTFYLSFGLCLAVAGLIALALQSVREWQAASGLLASQRAEIVLTLLSNALDQDMKGAHVSVLLPIESEDLAKGLPDDLRDTFARAFPRFPYVESFFVLETSQSSVASLYFFNRTNRPPAWGVPPEYPVTYPVTMERNPAAAEPFVQALRQHAVGVGRFSVFDWMASDDEYQVVAKRVSTGASTVASIVGFTVNLRWTRDHYLGELIQEVSEVGDPGRSSSITITDDKGQTVASTKPDAHPSELAKSHQFPLLFFDRAVVSTLSGPQTSRSWTATVEASSDPVLVAAREGVYRTYALLTVTATACVVGLLLTVRVVRASANLAALQSDFTSTVTHELKTPLTSIRLLGETLSDRQHSSETIRDYARMLSQEAWRLTRLIDNLLTYAGTTKPQQVCLERLDVIDLVDETLEHFRAQLTDRQFDVTVDVSADLPHIQGDRLMLLQALENLVDNAIKYSVKAHALSVRCWAERHELLIEVADRGTGIAPEEVPHVFDKFYRGRTVRTGGSGLGLAIVKQVMQEHHGTVTVSSVPQIGTTLRLSLPLDANSG